MNIVRPKRLPRKLKKKVIKSWGRYTYHMVMKGNMYILPWVIQYEKPIVMGYVGDEDVMKNFEKQLKEDYGEEKLKEIESRYATKKINENYYGKINISQL